MSSILSRLAARPHHHNSIMRKLLATDVYVFAALTNSFAIASSGTGSPSIPAVAVAAGQKNIGLGHGGSTFHSSCHDKSLPSYYIINAPKNAGYPYKTWCETVFKQNYFQRGGYTQSHSHTHSHTHTHSHSHDHFNINWARQYCYSTHRSYTS